MNIIFKNIKKCLTATATALVPSYKKHVAAKKSARRAAVLQQAFEEISTAWSDLELSSARLTISIVVNREDIDLGPTLLWPKDTESPIASPIPLAQIRSTCSSPCAGYSKASERFQSLAKGRKIRSLNQIPFHWRESRTVPVNEVGCPTVELASCPDEDQSPEPIVFKALPLDTLAMELGPSAVEISGSSDEDQEVGLISSPEPIVFKRVPIDILAMELGYLGYTFSRASKNPSVE